MKHLPIALIVITFALVGPIGAEEPAEKPAAEAAVEVVRNPIAVIETSMGAVHVELWPKAAPKTVKNFLDLAEGRKEFTDPKTGEKVTRPFYDGLVFHRVIRDFMVQGGCPLGTGTGSPGFAFEDEINAKGLGLHKLKAVDQGRPHPWLLIRNQQAFQQTVLIPLFKKLGISNQEQLTARQAEVQRVLDGMSVMDVYLNLGYEYDEKLVPKKPLKGVIAMANSGPKTNGSQFFLNLVNTDHLTGKHTVFGRVIKGMDVVEAIGVVPVDGMSRPLKAVKILTIREKVEDAPMIDEDGE